MNKIINKIKQQFDLSDLKGDPFEDLAKLFRFIFVFAMSAFIVAIVGLIIKVALLN